MKRSAKKKIILRLRPTVGDVWVDNSPYVDYGSPCTMLLVGTSPSVHGRSEPCWETLKTDKHGNTRMCRYETFTVEMWYKEAFIYDNKLFLVRS